jgi:hypothetical protein
MLLNPVVPDRHNNFCGLSSGALGTYVRWVQGMNPVNVIPRSTYFKHKRELKEKCGLDISKPCPERFKEVVIDIKRQVHIRPVTELPPFYYLPPIIKGN